jgi:hypothetical protein
MFCFYVARFVSVTQVNLPKTCYHMCIRYLETPLKGVQTTLLRGLAQLRKSVYGGFEFCVKPPEIDVLKGVWIQTHRGGCALLLTCGNGCS